MDLQVMPLFLFFSKKLISIGVYLVYNVVVISAVQQSKSVICIHIPHLFQASFPFRSLQSTEQSSLCYTVASHQLSIFCIVVCIWRRHWHPTPVLLPGKPHGWRSLVGCSLSDFTFTFHFHALEKEMATHSSVLAWRIPGPGQPGGLPSMGSHRVGHD